ncbi:hypothetical protein [Moorena producens]|nr:hypothetical protein [Moorena producens]
MQSLMGETTAVAHGGDPQAFKGMFFTLTSGVGCGVWGVGCGG